MCRSTSNVECVLCVVWLVLVVVVVPSTEYRKPRGFLGCGCGLWAGGWWLVFFLCVLCVCVRPSPPLEAI
jgi:hypothetical protein